MKTYSKFGKRRTPQSEPIPDTDQVKNSAGGFVWGIDNWQRLARFLVLGSEGGTYYVSEQNLTVQNAKNILACIKEDGIRTVDMIVSFSAGRIPKNDTALFALALAASYGNLNTRRYALAKLPDVARIGTHLFHFMNFVTNQRGFGRSLRTALANWYNDKPVNKLAYQLIKYQQRDGWSHRDILRIAHPKAPDDLHDQLYNWVTQKEYTPDLPDLILAYKLAQDATTDELVTLIKEHNLPREAIPTVFLNDVKIWEALLQDMPMTAMIRNLAKMTAIGLLGDWNDATAKVCERLNNENRLISAKIHPLAVLVALFTYRRGYGVRGSLQWKPVTQIVDSLDSAFYKSFGAVEPTGKRIMLALDVSGSMANGEISGLPYITPKVASAAMALVTAKVEPKYMTIIFSSAGTNFLKTDYQRFFYGKNGISTITISPRQRLDDVFTQISGLPFGGTDCALPMIYAIENGLSIDAFIVYTDSETWAGDIHPSQALKMYREKSGIPAKLIVVGMTSTGFSIADPNDSGMLDVVGFDTATPNLISQFIKGEI